MLGGARNSDETAEQAAGREAAEEAGLEPSAYTVIGRYLDDHGGWSYTTVLACTDRATLPSSLTAETVEVRWVPMDRLDELPLHPGFAAGPVPPSGPAPPVVSAEPCSNAAQRSKAPEARQASRAAGSMVTGNGSDSVSCCPGSARPTST